MMDARTIYSIVSLAPQGSYASKFEECLYDIVYISQKND